MPVLESDGDKGVSLIYTCPFKIRGHVDSQISFTNARRCLSGGYFALANTGIVFDANWAMELTGPNSMGVILGLVIGKPLGVALVSAVAVTIGICTLPTDVRWGHLVGAGMLGGIGFTISIFITNLAFSEQAELINASKIAVFTASLIAGVIGLLWLRFFCEDPENEK